ncbi:U-box domain-containing protein 21-like isoform X2 [Juglans microcarpa x Juglans regia]|uniref:U-box domain-containing protein 21-like isoform X2 n=1 Tax=Juglans microcarpa x Juglans regia TaxID=2249226 RepID=UPI001B7F37C1|nr:U-box domain-containing protein 21-like isoform X2 [Juglans microcarpa x Juglans regia]
MPLGWRRRRKASHDGKKHPGNSDMELVIPNHFQCPISLDLMKDPVTLSSGITYDRESIETWLEAGNFTCPVTKQMLKNFDRIPNHALTKMIQDWCVEKEKYGVQRIPTPRIPVAPVEVSEILFGVTESARRLDQYRCLELVQKIQKWGAESERNRRCIVANGAAAVLAAAFDTFANESIERNATVLEDILSALNWMFPVDTEAQKSLGSRASLGCLVWFLSCRDLSPKENSLSVLKELLACDQQLVEKVSSIEGVNEILIELVRKQICPTVTKASIMILVDSEKSIGERALGVFDGICCCKEGREEAQSNALTIPVLVKKILRLSDLATKYSISAILKLCKYGSRHEAERVLLVEALQVGAFQKLLLVIQVGCGDETKEKATELMKLLNPYRVAGFECIETTDFKNLKRSF